VTHEGEAMRAIKLSATVGRDRTLVLQLPQGTPEGNAEVIVLVSETLADSTDVEGLLRNVESWRARHPARRSKEEIDHDVEAERASWGET